MDVRDVHETPKDAASFEAIISSTNFRTLTTKESLKGDVRRRQWVRVAQLSKVANRRNRENQRSEEHTSELQSHSDLVCRLLLEKKKKKKKQLQNIAQQKTNNEKE